jgi:hypothetical protein
MMLATVGGAVLKQRRRYTAPFSGGGGGTPAWRVGKNLLQWYEWPNSSLSLAMAGYSAPGGSKNGITAYSGMAHSDKDLYGNGGGHGDYAGNEMVKLDTDLDAPAFAVLRNPTASVQIDVSHYADGRPTSAHTCYDLQYIAARNRVFRFGANATWGNANGFNNIDAFNLGANDWDAANTWPTASICDNVARCVAKDADDNVYIIRTDNGAMFRWNQASGTITSLGTRNTYNYGMPMAYDPVRNRLVRFNSTFGARFSVPDGTETAVSFTGATAGVQRYLSALWCNDRSSFLTMPWMSAAPAVYEVDPVSFAVSTLSIAGTPPPAASDDGYGWLPGRFAYLSKHKVCVYVRGYSDNVWFFLTG